MVELSCGVDIGGTKILAGVIDALGTVVDEVRVDTPASDPKAIEDAIVSAVTELAKKHTFSTVGLGAAGWIDRSGSLVYFAPHLSWRNVPLKAQLLARLPYRITIDNDANTGAWGEYRFGAGMESTDFMLITVGTGIGGGLVFGGELYRGAYGVAAEMAHMGFVPGGVQCDCGNQGCWEQYASGTALTRRAREAGLEWSGADITRAAEAGDAKAIQLFNAVGRDLGLGIASLVAILDPAMVAIGGGVAAAGDLLIAPARDTYKANLTGRGYRPAAEIQPAVLGNRAGWIGAADLAAPWTTGLFARSRRRRAERLAKTVRRRQGAEDAS